jgi:hypothetical protein
MTFHLPDDKDDFNYANKGAEYHSVIHAVSEIIRLQLKHGDEAKDREVLESVREELLAHIE